MITILADLKLSFSLASGIDSEDSMSTVVDFIGRRRDALRDAIDKSRADAASLHSAVERIRLGGGFFADIVRAQLKAEAATGRAQEAEDALLKHDVAAKDRTTR
jgi:hypothetical protein